MVLEMAELPWTWLDLVGFRWSRWSRLDVGWAILDVAESYGRISDQAQEGGTARNDCTSWEAKSSQVPLGIIEGPLSLMAVASSFEGSSSGGVAMG